MKSRKFSTSPGKEWTPTTITPINNQRDASCPHPCNNEYGSRKMPWHPPKLWGSGIYISWTFILANLIPEFYIGAKLVLLLVYHLNGLMCVTWTHKNRWDLSIATERESKNINCRWTLISPYHWGSGKLFPGKVRYGIIFFSSFPKKKYRVCLDLCVGKRVLRIRRQELWVVRKKNNKLQKFQRYKSWKMLHLVFMEKQHWNKTNL